LVVLSSNNIIPDFGGKICTFIPNVTVFSALFCAICVRKLSKLNINEGMVMENVVAQMLRRNGHKLYFYSRNDKEHRKNHMEIDFLITEKKKIAPIEVKSGRYTSHSSLDKFKKKFSSKLGDSYILYTKDVLVKDNIIHLPVYMAMFL